MKPRQGGGLALCDVLFPPPPATERRKKTDTTNPRKEDVQSTTIVCRVWVDQREKNSRQRPFFAPRELEMNRNGSNLRGSEEVGCGYGATKLQA